MSKRTKGPADLARTIEMAVGGSYQLPDGRSFWIDTVTAREITSRVCAALAKGDRNAG